MRHRTKRICEAGVPEWTAEADSRFYCWARMPHGPDDAPQVPNAPRGTGAGYWQRAGGGIARPGSFSAPREHGALRMLDSRVENTQVELQQGTALVEVVEMPTGNDIHVVGL